MTEDIEPVAPELATRLRGAGATLDRMAESTPARAHGGHRALAVAVLVLIAGAVAGTGYLWSSKGGGSTTVAMLPADTSAGSSIEEPGVGVGEGLIEVVDQDGVIRGSIGEDDAQSQQEQVWVKLRELGFDSSESPEARRLTAALLILEPLPVTDSDGVTVGYWASYFIELDDYERSASEALATVTDASE